MSKSFEAVEEVVRNPKRPFRVDSQPDKAHKHRYERRKIREFVRYLASASGGEPA
jgi:hypothetical protein